MKESGRVKIEDSIFESNLENSDFHNKYLVRVGAKDKVFTKVNFNHTYFENCYFRNIQFSSCNFNGSKFTNCNFQGSSFIGSIFEYAIFEKTYIDSEILNNNCPSYNNLKLKFARTLRVNYQTIGDAQSVNKAIKIELEATKEHLYESWKSNSAYYRKKYNGLDRVGMFFQWLNFKIQDFCWGNGESALKLFRTGFILWFAAAIIDTACFKDPNSLKNYLISFGDIPSYFMGIIKPQTYPNWYLTLIIVLRFIGFALFTSIIIKRYNRR